MSTNLHTSREYFAKQKKSYSHTERFLRNKSQAFMHVTKDFNLPLQFWQQHFVCDFFLSHEILHSVSIQRETKLFNRLMCNNYSSD